LICIIAGNYHEAKTWADGQNLEKKEWFYPEDERVLNSYCAFHVVVIGTAGENVPSSYFNRIYTLARLRGRIGRL